jgi:hypothetical protein
MFPQTGGSFTTARTNITTAGIDVCAQIASAIASLPPSGGTVDLSATGGGACAQNPFAENNIARVPVPVSLILGPGTIRTTTQWVIQTSNVSIKGPGTALSRIQYTGAAPLYDPLGFPNPGGIIEFVAVHSSEGSYPNGEPSNNLISGVAILGNPRYKSAAPYGLFVDGVIHSRFMELSIWGVVNDCYREIFGVLNQWDHVRCSANEVQLIGAQGTQQPQNGLYLAGYSSSYQAAADTVIDPIMEGLSVAGIQLNFALEPVIVGGTAEQNGVVNIAVGTSGSGTNGVIGARIVSTVTEATSGADVIDYGFQDSFQSLKSLSGSKFYGKNASVSHSFLGKVIIEPGATGTKFDHVFFYDAPTNGGIDTTCEDCNVGGLQAENTPWPWNYRSTTKMISDSIRVEANPKDFLQGVWSFSTAARAISDTPLTNGQPWHAVFIGEWTNNRGVAAQAPAVVELSDTNPSFCYNALCFTASIIDGVFKGFASSGIIAFAGEILVIPANSSTSGTAYLQTSDSIATGTKTVYRCVNAGNLPSGALTTTAGDCGSAQDSGLRIR